LVVFRQDKRFAARRQGVPVALLNGLGSFAARQVEVLGGGCQIGAGGKPHKIQRVSGGPYFVQVVHAPNQTSFLVPPSAKIFDMQVTDGEHGGRFCQVSANLRPMLQPAVEGGAEEGKGVLRLLWCFSAMS